MKNLVLVPARLVVVSAWGQGSTLRNLLDLEVVQALLSVTVPGETMKNFNSKLVPSVESDGIV